MRNANDLITVVGRDGVISYQSPSIARILGYPVGDASDFINAGNPIAAIIDVVIAIERATLSADVPPLLMRYTWFHVGFSLVCIIWSIARLRTISGYQQATVERRPRAGPKRARFRSQSGRNSLAECATVARP